MDQAQTVEATYKVKPGLYVLGSLERGLTVHRQQIRAHNLVWALWQLSRHGGLSVKNAAVVGGGIAGLTATACLLSRFDRQTKVTLFERRDDLCPLQQGADTRWLHPRIYNWPAPGSRAPSASLPVLNWSEGRASDVARSILELFGVYCEHYALSRLSIYIGLRHLQVNAATLQIKWVGNRAEIDGPFLQFAKWEGDTRKFDIIILASGFGLETQHEEYPTDSYWRNETYAQPVLNGITQSYVVAGYGDGALIDLSRLTIERYRQDTILYDVFSDDLEKIEEQLFEQWTSKTPLDNVFEFFISRETWLLAKAITALSKRIRKDTRVLLHLSGRDGEIKEFAPVFGGKSSSFQNRLFLFMLFRCGAFHIAFGDLAAAVNTHGATGRHVLCRYGVEVMQHLQAIVIDFDTVKDRLAAMKVAQEQTATELWETGFFPHHASRRP